MTDFAGAGDRDLRAVVRGCDGGGFSPSMDNPPTCFSPLITDNDMNFNKFYFPEYLFDSGATSLDELGDLYNPFYPPTLLDPLSPQSPILEKLPPEEVAPEERNPLSGAVVTAAANCTKALKAKYKRRKNQHKRVVMEVTAEGLSSDMWAWRKYGQKPIKGSPYPRSYYRCSSSKGCLARKQVERSHLDPNTFIVTYTAEHNHTQPTRRNSLAGTTRQRFSSATKSSAAAVPSDLAAARTAEVSGYLATSEVEIKKERGVIKEAEFEQKIAESDKFNQFVVCNMIMSDDFLAGFEELDAWTPSDLGYHDGPSSFW